MNYKDVKQSNYNQIYFYLRENGPTTTKDLTYHLSLSAPTVVQNLDALSSKGLVASKKKIANNMSGRNPIAHQYLPEAKIAIGLDIADQHMQVVAVNLSGDIIAKKNYRKSFERNETYYAFLGECINELVKEHGIVFSRILGVGLAMPGLISLYENRVYYGRVIDNGGLEGAEIGAYIDYECNILHDTYTAGLTELWFNEDINYAFYFTLLDSIGGILIQDDHLYIGESVYSGEIGHIEAVTDGKKCYCGKSGCFDSYLNATVLSCHTEGNLDLFFARLKQGDHQLITVWHEYLDMLAKAITIIRLMYGSKIIIGGYIGYYIGDYLDELFIRIDKQSPFGDYAKDYVIASQQGDTSVALGAGLYYIDQFLSNI